MSGSIPQFNPRPIGPDYGKAIADAAALMQQQEAQKQVERQNQLRTILGGKDAFDPMGQPKPDTVSKIWGVDPNAAMAIQRNAMTGLNQQAQLQERQIKRQSEIQELIEPVRVASMEAYNAAPGDEAAKRAAAQKVYTEELDRITAAGHFSDQEKTMLNPQFDPVRVGAMSSRWQDHLKQKQTQKYQTTQQEIERERIARMATHDEQMNRRAGATEGQDADGRSIFFYPNEAPDKRVQYPDGTSVPPDKQKDARRMGTGAASAQSQENQRIAAAETARFKEKYGHPPTTDSEIREYNEGVQAAVNANLAEKERLKAGARQGATAKPTPVTVDGKAQDGVWKNGQWFQPDGTTPITGAVRLAAKPATSGSPAAERAARFDEMKAAQQEAGTYKDDTTVWRSLDHQMAEDKDPPITDQAAKTAAQVALKTGRPPAWMGRSKGTLNKFLEAFSTEAKAQGLDADAIAANIAKFSGEMAEARTLGTMSARVDFAAKELEVALPQALAVSERVWRPGFKKLAEIQQAIKGQVSDPDLLEFAQFNQQVISAYSAMMSRGGISTVHGNERAEALLSTATSQAGYTRQLDTLHKEVQTILFGTQAAKDHLRAEITGAPEITTPPTLTGVPRPGAATPQARPPEDAIKHLKEHPETAPIFEKHWPGQSQRYLQGNQTAPDQTAPAQPTSLAPPARPAPAAAPSGQVARPTTQAEFDAVPPGGLYVNPADGKTYRKNAAP